MAAHLRNEVIFVIRESDGRITVYFNGDWNSETIDTTSFTITDTNGANRVQTNAEPGIDPDFTTSSITLTFDPVAAATGTWNIGIPSQFTFVNGQPLLGTTSGAYPYPISTNVPNVLQSVTRDSATGDILFRFNSPLSPLWETGVRIDDSVGQNREDIGANFYDSYTVWATWDPVPAAGAMWDIFAPSQFAFANGLAYSGPSSGPIPFVLSLGRNLASARAPRRGFRYVPMPYWDEKLQLWLTV